jgi:hypothetical protein
LGGVVFWDGRDVEIPVDLAGWSCSMDVRLVRAKVRTP